MAAAPFCTILGIQTELAPNVLSTAFAWERTDPNISHGFKDVGTISPQLGFATDIYAIDEAWLQTSAGPVLVRAQAHPATRPAFMDKKGSAWSLNARDASFSWSGIFAFGTANSGNEQDDPAAAAATVPQLMKVGDMNQQLFACAGGRSEDDRVRTTMLYEVKPPDFSASPPTGGSKAFIQDLLNGDDRFVPNAPGALIGPATPPTPTINNRPGNPVTQGAVQCVMTQAGDDIATRELHMLTISNGTLYHSLASNWSPATSGSGSFTFDRFNTVTPWGDVGQALGTNFGTVVASAVVASRPTAISAFFVAQAGDGRYRLWHTVRFSNGSWRPADDILKQNGGTLTGTNFPFKVAAGVCPVMGQSQTSEVVYVMWDEDADTHAQVGRVVSTPQQWAPGIQGIYSPMDSLSVGGVDDPARQPSVLLRVSSRPFHS